MTTTTHRPLTVFVGSPDCLERECDEYFTANGDEDPGVERCSHITTEEVCADCSVELNDGFMQSTVPWPCRTAAEVRKAGE
ncbi:hypothetical protein ABZ547_08515 [Streptomyces sparsogenes]|uniref:hypothetical protein n=1 Tax=Streptomyces sparsogenes TaxID=67365 RepID=UPI0033E60103